MNITDIRIFPVDDAKLKAFVSIIIDHCFLVSGIKIIDGNNGLFLSMPSKKRRDGTFKDIAHPLNSETRNKMEKVIIAKYHEELELHPLEAGAPPLGEDDIPPPAAEEGDISPSAVKVVFSGESAEETPKAPEPEPAAPPLSDAPAES